MKAYLEPPYTGDPRIASALSNWPLEKVDKPPDSGIARPKTGMRPGFCRHQGRRGETVLPEACANGPPQRRTKVVLDELGRVHQEESVVHLGRAVVGGPH
ncbi:hypothetical protein [Candidatus Methylacidithermus pantelleriae]|nr:hypothetical protein [Candidatus Methylacidithermus pantelleriae]